MSRRIVVVGASAGGVEALVQLAKGLPADLDAAVAVVLHVSPRAPSALPEILSRAGPLAATHPEDGDSLDPATIYVAPPDHHLLVHGGTVRLARGARENGHRPAIDPLFRSAAAAYRAATIGVVLSGTRDDGAAGVAAVAAQGGRVLVQDPADARYPSMPEHAIAADHPEYVVPVDELPALVTRLAAEPVSPQPATDTEEMEVEESYAELGSEATGRVEPPGHPSPVACPACGGALWQADDDALLRFRCRVGHAFGAESLLDAESETVEAALWTALRALEERSHLSRRLAKRLRERHGRGGADRYERQATEAEQHAKVLREVLVGRTGGSRGE